MRSYARFLGLCCLILACDTNSGGNKDTDAGNGGQHDAGGTGGDGDKTEPDAGGMDAGGGGMDAGHTDAGGGDGGVTVDAGPDSGGGGGDGDTALDGGGDGDVTADAGTDAGAVVMQGLRADYFDGKSFVNHVLTRVDANINFDWGGDPPFPKCDASHPAPCFTGRTDRWSVRWLGQLEPLYNEDYKFYASADDGVKVWIDDTLVINNWNESDASTKESAPITLQANKRYSIRVEYFQGAGTAHAKLEWSSASETRAAIPTSQLFAADTNTHWDVGVCTGANTATDYPNPNKNGCNSFETELNSGSTYENLTSGPDGDHKNIDCGPCSPVSWGPEAGRNIRFDVPNDGDPRSTVSMTIPRTSAGKYWLRFWFALERTNMTDPPVVATATVNGGIPFDITIHPTLIRDASTVNEQYDFLVDLKAGNNTVVVAGPDFGASPAEIDLLRFDRITVENQDHTTP
jgi:hypothetical protein